MGLYVGRKAGPWGVQVNKFEHVGWLHGQPSSPDRQTHYFPATWLAGGKNEKVFGKNEVHDPFCGQQVYSI